MPKRDSKALAAALEKYQVLEGVERDLFVLENPCPACESTPMLASVGVANDEKYYPHPVGYDIVQVSGPIYVCYSCGWSIRAQHPDTWMKEFFRLNGEEDEK